MYKSILTCLISLLVFFTNQSIANIAKSEDNTEFRVFEQERIDLYASDNDFVYSETPPSNFWNSIVEWFIRQLEKIFDDYSQMQLHSIVSLSVKILLWSIGIFAVVMIFYSLFRHGVFNVIARKDKNIEIDFEKLEEMVPETDWHSMIIKEISDGRYNTAIRLLFLQAIQILNNKQLIRWEKNKTNRDYIKELRSCNMDSQFSELTLYYNYIWFGDFKIKEREFLKIHNDFKEFNSK